MHVPVLRVASLLAATTLAACASDRSTAPTNPPPAAAVSTAGTLTLTCDATFSTQKSDARAFFSSSQDPIFTILKTMASAYKTGGAAAATSSGFDALQRIAVARGTSAQGGPATAGRSLTEDVLACMSVGAIPSSFDANILTALSSGIYEVRGADPSAGAALAFATSPGQKTAASPEWGIESLGSWGAKFNGAATRFLVYGAPVPVNSFTSELASTDPNNVAFTGFDISTVPVMPGLVLADQIRVGICIDPATNSVPNRIIHGGATTTILPLDPPGFCSGNVASAVRSGSLLARIARGAFDLIAPKPAYAFTLIGGTGGLPSGLSPFGPVIVNAQNVSLTFVQQPSNGSISAPIAPPVTVQATTANGTPVGGVTITLTIYNNQGQPATATGNVATTGEFGVASFPNLTLTKAGGYIITASGSISGNATKTVNSVLFNVNGQ
jgi:hypothetical protein